MNLFQGTTLVFQASPIKRKMHPIAAWQLFSDCTEMLNKVPAKKHSPNKLKNSNKKGMLK